MSTSRSLGFCTTLFVALSTLAACGSDGGGTGGEGTTTSTNRGGSGTTTSTSSTSTTSTSTSSTTSTTTECSGVFGDGTECPGGDYSSTGSPVPGGTVTATIVDETGAPVKDLVVYVCGTDVCSQAGYTKTDGTISIGPAPTMRNPAFKFGDAVDYAELSVPITQAVSNFGTLATGRLVDKPGAELKPGTDAKSGDVTISIPAGASVVIDSLVYDTCEKQQLRTVNIPLTHLGPVISQGMTNSAPVGLALYYGVTPAMTTVCPAAKVTVALPQKAMMPNDLGWAPGADVEFWITTVSTAGVYAPYAGWAKASDGKVSADGATVSTVDGGGFVYLDNFAIRLKEQ